MRRFAVPGGLLLAACLLAGCATATIEDAVPAGALAHAPAGQGAQPHAGAPASAAGDDAAIAAAPPEERAPTAGTFPDLNVPPAAAAPQISPQQTAAETAQLRAKRDQLARQGQGQGQGQSAGGDERLRRLARSHGEDVLKEIEGR